MKKTLYMMRHGETLFNVRRKKQGWCDSPLTENGIQQAKHARAYLEQHHIVFDHAYSSTSERACDTMELVSDMPYTRVKGIKEWNFGMFEGESEDLNPSLPYGDFFAQYGGEKEMEFRERLVSTITTIMNQEDHNCVLMVSHGAALAQIMRAFSEYAKVERKGRIANCGIMKFTLEDAIFTLEEIIDPNDL